MKKNEKNALVALLGGIGFIFLFAGIFITELEFTYGLFAALVCWILSGVLKAYLGVGKK